MEKNPKKSKALIIAFAITLVLIFGIYFIFIKDGGISNTKSAGGKLFAPLLGTSKNKELNTVDKTNTPTDITKTEIPNTGQEQTTTDTPNTSNIGNSLITPNLNPIPLPTNNYGFQNPCDSNQQVNNNGNSCDGNNLKYKTVFPANFIPQCKDGLDNDQDGLKDILDPGCHTNLEVYKDIPKEVVDTTPVKLLPSPANTGAGSINSTTIGGASVKTGTCADTIDNDGDNLKDLDDPDCHTDQNSKNSSTYDPTFNETGTLPANMMPNPEIKKSKYPSKTSRNPEMIMIVDTDTYDENKSTELDFIPACRDGADNDQDGLIDELDPGCHSDLNPNNTNSYLKDKTIELNIIPQCSNGKDDDGDKLTDINDPGCHSDLNTKNKSSYMPDKSTEFNIIPQCSDNIDNDSDNTKDALDSNCWADGKTKTLYDPNYGSEFANNNTNKNNNTNNNRGNGYGIKKQCNEADIALQFTDSEKAQLAELTRQFNLLAPFLKSQSDVNGEEDSTRNYKYIIENAKSLTQQCIDQTSRADYKQTLGSKTEQIEGGISSSVKYQGRDERRYNPYQSGNNKNSEDNTYYRFVSSLRIDNLTGYTDQQVIDMVLKSVSGPADAETIGKKLTEGKTEAEVKQIMDQKIQPWTMMSILKRKFQYMEMQKVIDIMEPGKRNYAERVAYATKYGRDTIIQNLANGKTINQLLQIYGRNSDLVDSTDAQIVRYLYTELYTENELINVLSQGRSLHDIRNLLASIPTGGLTGIVKSLMYIKPWSNFEKMYNVW